MHIANDTILITGGSAGIGRALAEAMHRDGAKIIITGRREDALRAVADANPGMAWAVLDMTDADAIAAFAAQVTRDHPALNAIIHNAGIMEVEDLTSEPWDLDRVDRTLDTNLLGPVRLTAGLIGHLKRQPRASLMTVSSGLAFVPLAATPIYSATKAAIHSWTQALRTQLKDTSIEVLELAPPGVATDLMPGHAENPASMPLDDYIAEVMDLIRSGNTPAGEILVERVKPLRFAERDGYPAVYARLNGG
jgi:uncharacterized oxidoreductase